MKHGQLSTTHFQDVKPALIAKASYLIRHLYLESVLEKTTHKFGKNYPYRTAQRYVGNFGSYP